jgi:hypothetical protein
MSSGSRFEGLTRGCSPTSGQRTARPIQPYGNPGCPGASTCGVPVVMDVRSGPTSYGRCCPMCRKAPTAASGLIESIQMSSSSSGGWQAIQCRVIAWTLAWRHPVPPIVDHRSPRFARTNWTPPVQPAIAPRFVSEPFQCRSLSLACECERFRCASLSCGGVGHRCRRRRRFPGLESMPNVAGNRSTGDHRNRGFRVWKGILHVDAPFQIQCCGQSTSHPGDTSRMRSTPREDVDGARRQ